MMKHTVVIPESFDTECNYNKAFLFLHKCGFKSCQWKSLAPFLHVPFGDRKKLLSSYEESKNHDWVLEEMLDYWITHHSSQPTLEELTKAVEDCGERDAAIAMKKELQNKFKSVGKFSFFVYLIPILQIHRRRVTRL